MADNACFRAPIGHVKQGSCVLSQPFHLFRVFGNDVPVIPAGFEAGRCEFGDGGQFSDGIRRLQNGMCFLECLFQNWGVLYSRGKDLFSFSLSDTLLFERSKSRSLR